MEGREPSKTQEWGETSLNEGNDKGKSGQGGGHSLDTKAWVGPGHASLVRSWLGV